MNKTDVMLEFLGIKKWHELGYTGNGIKIMSDEKVCQSKHNDVISPAGFKDKLSHGDSVMTHIKLVAPDSTFIAYPFNEVRGVNECEEYIKKEKVSVFTTSMLSGVELSKSKEKSMQNCIDSGCTFFAAAGNEGDKGLKGQSKSDKYLAIGGVNIFYKNGEYDFSKMSNTSYSSIGEELDYVTIAEILNVAGTSFCSPIFAGMCALVQQFFLKESGRTLYRSELISFINDNLIDTKDKGFDIYTGLGLFVLPDPKSIQIGNYVHEYSTSYIDYGGIPKEEEMNIQQMLLTPSPYNRPQTKIKPTAIAWHYVGNPNTSAINNRNYFESLGKSGNTYASSHFIIGLEGEILQLIPEDEKSFCTNQANDYAISIECCHPDSTGKFTEATYKSMIWLGKYLMGKWNITENIRHYDVTGKHCPKWFVDYPNEWEKFKSELEGDENMTRYKTIKEMPEYYQKDIKELIDKGIISGRGGEAGLDLSDDMCRMAIYAKRIFENK